MNRLIVAAFLAALGIVSAQAQSSEPQQTPLRDVRNATTGNYDIYEDKLTGCRYFVTPLPRNFGSSATVGIPTIRYRADGKPDCKNS